MAKKYKIILKVRYFKSSISIDSAEEIEGVTVWPNYSHAEPYCLKGVFDSYEEANEKTSKIKVYKFVVHFYEGRTPGQIYDSYEGWDGYADVDPWYFFSISDAQSSAEYQIDRDLAYDSFSRADYSIIQLKNGNKTRHIPAGVYTYKIVGIKNVCYYNSAMDGVYFKTYSEADNSAYRKSFDYMVNRDDSKNATYFKVEEIPIIDFRIEEIDV